MNYEHANIRKNNTPPSMDNIISEKIVIEKDYLEKIIPGMLMSAKTLIEELPLTPQNLNIYFFNLPGRAMSTTMIICHSCELLLKYKIQAEGNTIERKHDLYKLFNSLENNTKTEIETIFKDETPQHSLLPEPQSLLPELQFEMTDVESILKYHNDAFTEWRYNLATGTGKFGVRLVPLYNATLSIYKSTDIYSYNTMQLEIVKPYYGGIDVDLN